MAENERTVLTVKGVGCSNTRHSTSSTRQGNAMSRTMVPTHLIHLSMVSGQVTEAAKKPDEAPYHANANASTTVMIAVKSTESDVKPTVKASCTLPSGPILPGTRRAMRHGNGPNATLAMPTMRPLARLARSGDQAKLRTTLREFWQLTGVTSALLCGFMFTASTSPTDWQLGGTFAAKLFNVSAYVGSLSALSTLLLVTIAWAAMDKVPEPATGRLMLEHMWMLDGVAATLTVTVVAAIMCVASATKILAGATQDFGASLAAIVGTIIIILWIRIQMSSTKIANETLDKPATSSEVELRLEDIHGDGK